MMLLVNKENVIMFTADHIEFGTFEGEEKWKITEHLYALDNDYTLVEDVEVPEYVVPYQYCYTKEEGFYKNPNWIEPEKPAEERIKDLEREVSELRELIKSLTHA